MTELPLVSVVTPSYNMGRFIEETIRSVLSQDYPRIEYIVMDGGSCDGTLEILEKYRDRLQFQSQPDHGAADAIHRGFGLSKGSILAWLSADDTYLAGAVSAAVAALAQAPEVGVVYGDASWVDESGKVIGLLGIDMDVKEYIRRIQGLHLVSASGFAISALVARLSPHGLSAM